MNLEAWLSVTRRNKCFNSWLDCDKLTGFPEWGADFLENNPSMYGRTDSIFEGMQNLPDHVRLVFG